MIKNFEMTNSTMLERKHKGEYLKATVTELAARKLLRNTKTSSVEDLMKETQAYSKVVEKNKELATHQEDNRKDPEYQNIKAQKKEQKRLARLAKKNK